MEQQPSMPPQRNIEAEYKTEVGQNIADIVQKIENIDAATRGAVIDKLLARLPALREDAQKETMANLS